jgi:hypothetical protein
VLLKDVFKSGLIYRGLLPGMVLFFVYSDFNGAKSSHHTCVKCVSVCVCERERDSVCVCACV